MKILIFQDKYLAAHTAYDMDGVLCRDPADNEIPKGYWDRRNPLYLNFLRNAELLHEIIVPLGYIVTARMSMYRNITNKWLKQHKICYKELIMAPKSIVHTNEGHAKFKARIYKNLKDCNLFVESNLEQAKIIRQLSDKPVFYFKEGLLLN